MNHNAQTYGFQDSLGFSAAGFGPNYVGDAHEGSFVVFAEKDKIAPRMLYYCLKVIRRYRLRVVHIKDIDQKPMTDNDIRDVQTSLRAHRIYEIDLRNGSNNHAWVVHFDAVRKILRGEL